MEEQKDTSLIEKSEQLAAAVTKADGDKPAGEDFTALDYVKEIFLQGVEQEKREKKKLRLMRLCTAFMFVIMVAFVLALVLGGPMLKMAIDDFHTITLKVQELDIQKLTTEVDQFLSDATQNINAVGDAAKNVGALDIKAMNQAIDQLTKTVENLGKVNIEKLNQSIESFAAAADKLAKKGILGSLF